MVSEGPGAVFEEPKVCETDLKRPCTGSRESQTGFREGPTKTGFKRTSEGPKPEDLRPISQGPILMVSEGPGPGFRVL